MELQSLQESVESTISVGVLRVCEHLLGAWPETVGLIFSGRTIVARTSTQLGINYLLRDFRAHAVRALDSLEALVFGMPFNMGWGA